MKKVFWTSIVWIILILGFVAYMKWFGQPLAERVADFIYHNDVEIDCPEIEECACETCEVCEEVEPVECNCPAQTLLTWDVDTNWDNLFTQLNRIEKLVKSNNNTSTVSDEELFEEFKAWRSANEE